MYSISADSEHWKKSVEESEVVEVSYVPGMKGVKCGAGWQSFIG